MLDDAWVRIPAPIEKEEDRRALAGILASAGLMVRIVKAPVGQSASSPKRSFIEYRPQK